MTYRTGSFCTGICAPEVAWHALGWTPAFFSEIDPFASAVEAHRFPTVRNYGDMMAIDPAELPDADVWVAGTPCQAFSVAGLRRSLQDDRGNLTLHFVKLVHARNPLCVTWENVPGVLSTKDNAFGCFLAGLVGEGEPLVCGDGSWPDAGMVAGPVRSAAWRILDAQYVGLAQRRRRVFVVSFRTGDGTNPGAVLFEPESVRRDSPPRREAGAGVAACITSGAHPGGHNGQDDHQEGRLIPTIAFQANASGDSHISDTRDLAPTMRNGRGGGSTIPAVAYGIHSDALDRSGEGAAGNAAERAGLGISEDLSPCINAKRPNAVAAPIPFDTTQITSANNYSSPKPGDPCHPLASGAHAPAIALVNGDDHVHGKVQQVRGEASPERPESRGNGEGDGRGTALPELHPLSFQTRFARNGRGAPEEVCPTLQGASAGATSDMRPCVSAGMAVRRLTPKECERLQGFPDNYTLIPYRGKPAADGPRYRALGNSMAVPVLAWIGERIAKVLKAHAEREARP